MSIRAWHLIQTVRTDTDREKIRFAYLALRY
jgi:hypothetical protein